MKKQSRHSSKYDIVTDLPENVIDIILASLTLREAARTSILSKKWRYKWISLSKLVLDDTICRPSVDLDYLGYRYKILSTISNILLLHDGPITQFNLSHSFLKGVPEIDHFISFLSKKCLRDFTLKLSDQKYYKLPSSFFSYSELTHLDLFFCGFNPPSGFKGFCKLISLKFHEVTITSDVLVFNNFISSCLLLERMTLIDSHVSCAYEISAPNLKYLQFRGYSLPQLKSVPLLQSLVCDIKGSYRRSVGDKTCRFLCFFSCLTALNKLTASCNFLRYLAAESVNMKLPFPINLKILELSRISFDNPELVLRLCCLIRNSPSIRKIEIEVVPWIIFDVDPVLDHLKMQMMSDIIWNELREVRLLSVSGSEPELEFIKLLLVKSPVLETLQVYPHKEQVVPRYELLKNTIRLQQASPMAEIIIG